MLPVAHIGHWLWALYLPPVLIVATSILHTKLSERRRNTRDDSTTSGSPTDERD